MEKATLNFSKKQYFYIAIVLVVLVFLILGISIYLTFEEITKIPEEKPVKKGPLEIKPLPEEVIRDLTIPEGTAEPESLPEEVIRDLTIPK